MIAIAAACRSTPETSDWKCLLSGRHQGEDGPSKTHLDQPPPVNRGAGKSLDQMQSAGHLGSGA